MISKLDDEKKEMNEFMRYKKSINMIAKFNVFRDRIVKLIGSYENKELSDVELHAKLTSLINSSDVSNNVHEIKDLLTSATNSEIEIPLKQLQSFVEVCDDNILNTSITAIINVSGTGSFKKDITDLGDVLDQKNVNYIVNKIEYVGTILNSVVKINKTISLNYVLEKDIDRNIPEGMLDEVMNNAIKNHNESWELIQKYSGAQLRYLPEELHKQTEYLLDKSKYYYESNPKFACEYANIALKNAKMIKKIYENKNLYSELARGRV